jgi:hypothetical protein
MEMLVTALGPVLAAGFAVQQLLEIFSPLVERITGNDEKAKKMYLGLISLLFGFGLSFGAGLRVLTALGAATPYLVDGVVSGLIISGGTEGINSIMKFLGYTKEKEKANAAVAREEAGPAALEKID